MYTIKYTKKFRKDYKRCVSRGLDIELLRKAVDILARTGTLPAEYKPHKLSGRFKNRMECHIRPDWLLVWQQHDNELLLLFTDTGSHSDLF